MWTSLSFPKGVISPKYLYYPQRVGSSPYDITINFGPSVADQSTAVGDGLTAAIAGKLSFIYIQSRNSIGDIIDNTNDNYQLYFSGPNGLTTGEFYATAVYQADGLYKSQYVPQLAGTYVLTITLLGDDIKGSPWSVTVEAGEIDSSNCLSNLGVAPISGVAGMTKFFTINTFDMFGNQQRSSYTYTNITIEATYEDNTQYTSPLGIADVANWAEIYGRDIAGISQDNKDGSYAAQITIYRAGKFSLSIRINDIDISGSPYSLSTDYFYIAPSDIYAPTCVINAYTPTQTSGVAFTFYVQGRDFYANNIKTLSAAAITDYKLEIRDLESDSVITTGTITDAAAMPGVY
jgi:hypothetical protein